RLAHGQICSCEPLPSASRWWLGPVRCSTTSGAVLVPKVTRLPPLSITAITRPIRSPPTGLLEPLHPRIRQPPRHLLLRARQASRIRRGHHRRLKKLVHRRPPEKPPALAVGNR